MSLNHTTTTKKSCFGCDIALFAMKNATYSTRPRQEKAVLNGFFLTPPFRA
jgi:hypothetical protein